MNMSEYAKEARTTAIYPGQGTTTGLYYATMGLAGEVGEVCNKVKKILRDDNGVLTPKRQAELEGEYGDIFWYIAMSMFEAGLDPAKVMQANLDKLASRQERGVLKGAGDTR